MDNFWNTRKQALSYVEQLKERCGLMPYYKTSIINIFWGLIYLGNEEKIPTIIDKFAEDIYYGDSKEWLALEDEFTMRGEIL